MAEVISTYIPPSFYEVSILTRHFDGKSRKVIEIMYELICALRFLHLYISKTVLLKHLNPFSKLLFDAFSCKTQRNRLLPLKGSNVEWSFDENSAAKKT